MIVITTDELNEAYNYLNINYKINGYPTRVNTHYELTRQSGEKININFILDNYLGPKGNYVLDRGYIVDTSEHD